MGTAPFLGGWAGVGLLVFGLPGHIDDAGTWWRWMTYTDTWLWLGLSIGFIVTGPVIWTAGWWYPKCRARWSTPKAEEPVSESTVLLPPHEYDIQLFRSLAPLIRRVANSYQHVDLLNVPFRGIDPLFTPDAVRTLKFRLDELKIPYPSDNAPDFEWSGYLGRLAPLSEEGRLFDARRLHFRG